MKRSRGWSFLFTVAVYVAATAVGIVVYRLMRGDTLLRLFAADIAATLLIYLISLPLKNASVYDPYWSVAPIVILPLAITDFGIWNLGSALLLLCIGYWGVRLTANWAYTFHGYKHQDWRYTMLREKSGAFYPLVSLFGIMLFPTLVVYLCLLPALRYAQSGGVNLITALGFGGLRRRRDAAVVADLQLHRFQKRATSKNEIIRTGVWKHAASQFISVKSSCGGAYIS
ncbi:MAG: DUF1295 domain-containing protein [Eubacteriales bacterium]